MNKEEIPQRNDLQKDNSTKEYKDNAISDEADFYSFLDQCKNNKIFGIANQLQELNQYEISPEMRKKIVEYYKDDARNNQSDLEALEKFKKAATTAVEICFPGPIYIVRALTEKYRFRTIPEIGTERENVYFYNGAVYERAEERIKEEAHSEYIKQWEDMMELAEDEKIKSLAEKLRNSLDRGPSVNDINEVVAMIRRTTFTHDEMNPSSHIPFKNGLLNLETQKLEPFTPNLFYTYQVNANLLEKYVTLRDTPMFADLLNTAFYQSDIPMVLSYFAYSFYPDLPAHKTLFVLGRERIGKGTSVRVLQGLMPKGSGSLSLARLLTSDRFQFTGIEGKNILVDSETKRKFRRGTILEWSAFCNLFGKDVLSVEPKGHEAHDYVSKAKGIFLGNLPFIPVDSPPAIARMLVVQTRNDRPKRTIPDLDRKILDAERDKIATLLVQILFKLMGKDFLFPGQMTDESTAAVLDQLSDPVENFIEEETEPVEGVRTSVDDVYTRFIEWSESKGIPTLARQTFVKKFGYTYPKKLLGPRGNREYFFVGCQLNQDDIEVDAQGHLQVEHGEDALEMPKKSLSGERYRRVQHEYSHPIVYEREKLRDHGIRYSVPKLNTGLTASPALENKAPENTKGVFNLIRDPDEPFNDSNSESQSGPTKPDVPKQNPLYSMILDILIRLSSLTGSTRIDPKEIIDAWPSTSPIPCPGWNDLSSRILPTMAGEGLLRMSNGMVEVSS